MTQGDSPKLDDGQAAEMLQLLVHLRATMDVLSVMVVETAAQVSKKDVREVRTRFEELRQNAVFRLTYETQDRLSVTAVTGNRLSLRQSVSPHSASGRQDTGPRA